MFQKDSALAQWFQARTENACGTRKTMIVGLARKLLIALWPRLETIPAAGGVISRQKHALNPFLY
jgi:transposase